MHRLPARLPARQPAPLDDRPARLPGCPPPPQVPPSVYMWPTVAFGTAVLLNFMAIAFERRPAKRQLCFLAAYISCVAAVYECLAWQRRAPIYITPAGRPLSLLR